VGKGRNTITQAGRETDRQTERERERENKVEKINTNGLRVYIHCALLVG
jgi:hypothetical protein